MRDAGGVYSEGRLCWSYSQYILKQNQQDFLMIGVWGVKIMDVTDTIPKSFVLSN